MNNDAGAARVLRLLARKLEEYLDGDEMALETLAEALEEADVTPDDVQMVVLGLRGLASSAVAGREPLETASLPLPREIQRVLSAEERGVLTTEAWGYLLELRASGALDAHQLERVLEALTTYEERPVELAHARDVAARVALEPQDGTTPGDYPHGDQEVAH